MNLEKIIKSAKKAVRNSLLAGTLAACSLLGCDGKEVVYVTNPYQANHSPALQVIDEQTVQEGELLALNLEEYVSDEDGDPVVIEHLDGPGSIIDNVFQYQDSEDDNRVDETYNVLFKVSDGKGGIEIGSFKVKQIDTTPDPADINHNPVTQSIPDQTVQEGGSFDLNLDDYISDEDGDPLTVELIDGPGGITNNQFHYQDQRDDDKEDNQNTVSFRVLDGKGGESTGSFNLSQQDIFYRLPVSFFNNKINWICYAPTNFNPNMQQFPSDASIRADLQTLLDANIKGIITYGSDNILGSVPRIAKEMGFSHVIMGIWDYNNQEEWSNALNAAQDVDGYCLGNEGIIFGRYTLSDLITKIEQLRRATDKPVTTTEPVGSYNNDLIDAGDWVFPNTHPYWNNVVAPNDAANWTLQQYQNLIAATSKVVVLKEVGLPSAGDTGLSEANQNQYYRTLEDLTKNIAGTVFAFFEAFDQPWKNWAAVEPHWGLFNQDRSTKQVSAPQVIFTYVPPIGSYSDLQGRTVNIRPENYKISVHIKVNGFWYMKPYWAAPLTSISGNSNWITDITTGGTDAQATDIYAAIVTPDYNPLLLIVAGQTYNTLPSSSDPKVIASRQTNR